MSEQFSSFFSSGVGSSYHNSTAIDSAEGDKIGDTTYSETVAAAEREQRVKQREDDQVDLAIFVTFAVLLIGFGVIVTVSPPAGLAFMVIVYALYAIYFALPL
jgi:hypothetical protein